MNEYSFDLPSAADFRRASANMPSEADLRRAVADMPSEADLRRAVADMPSEADLRRAVANMPNAAELRRALADVSPAELQQAFVDAIRRWPQPAEPSRGAPVSDPRGSETEQNSNSRSKRRFNSRESDAYLSLLTFLMVYFAYAFAIKHSARLAEMARTDGPDPYEAAFQIALFVWLVCKDRSR
jgi:hypothetical protein